MAQWNQCFYCGCSLTKANRTVDHIEPKSFGGQKMVDACSPCNNSKGMETLDWFREYLGMEHFYGEIQGWKPW